MADLRIVDAPEIPTENITGQEKIPTGGSGNYSITLDSVADYTKTTKDLVDTTTVDGKVNGVRQELETHIEDLLNPHQVTKGQIGLGNVDNTADADKPVSNSTQSAIIGAVATKADKTYVDNQLTLKSDKTYVDSQLALKASQVDVDSSLLTKSDKTYVDDQLALKTDKTYTDSQLALKVDKTYVDSTLLTKADKTYTDSQLALKVDKTYVDSQDSSLQSQINQKATAEYLDNALTQQTNTVNTTLSNLSTVASKFYPTLAQANADIVNIAVNQVVNIGEVVNGGLWYKSTAGATSLTKSPYDPLIQAKSYSDANLVTAKNYTNTKTNLNFFKGFDQNAVSTSLLTYTLNQTNVAVTMDGGRLQLTMPTKGKLSNTCSVWVNVTSAVLNSGVMRALVQVRKKDTTNVHSNYYNIPNGTTGWFKLVDVNISAVNPNDIDAIIVNPEATGGAVLTISDVYVGDFEPTSGFTRFERIEDEILRSAVKTNIFPRFEHLPTLSGVTYSGERITINAGSTFSHILPIADKQVLYFSMLVNQLANRDMRIRLVGTPTDGTSGITRDVYTTATNGLEFSSSVDFGKAIKQVQVSISAIRTDAISIDRLVLSYDPVMQSKRAAPIKLPTTVSDLVDDSVTNLATHPKLNLLSLKTNAVWTDNSVALSGAASALLRQYVSEMGLVTGDVVYINFKGNVLKGGGAATVTTSQVRANGSVISSSGFTTTLTDGSNLYTNIPATVATDADRIVISFSTTVDATLSITDLIISKQKVYSYSKITTVNALDATGTQVSLFPYPKLNGYDTVGNAVAYSRYLNENGDWVLEVPATDTTATRGQGATFNFDYPDSFLGKGGYLSVMLSSPSIDTVTAYLVYKIGGTVTQELSSPVPMKNNGDFTEYLIPLSAKNPSNVDITGVSITFHQANTATGSLKIERPVLTAKLPYQNIKHIVYAVDTVAETGMPSRDRVYDALQNPVSGAFTTGRQVFVPDVDSPATINDFKLIGGRDSLPNKLIGTKYIDASGFEIITIDSDDSVYLRNTANTNIYKTTVDDLYSRISAVTLDAGSGEYRGTFDGSDLVPIASGFASNMYGRVAGDGSLICASSSEAKYLPVNGSALVAATGYVNTVGGLLSGWLFDVQDNIVLAGGYSAAPNYGQGKINFSNDHGRTYKTILDLENQTIFGATATASSHIHGCAWDKWWNRVWVVMGDYPFDSQAVGKILWCDNPQDANPVWHIEPRDLIQPNKHNEQHISVYPMQDCILFGSDCNPSYIARRARVSKDQATLTDMALYLHAGLAYYPAQFWRHNDNLPVTIFLGSDLLGSYGDNPDGVLITYDGVNFSRIWSDKNEYSNTSGRTSSYAYALPKERFLLQKRVDPRFSSGTCWVIGRLRMR